MKICVIGGTGHIGRNLVEMLVREGFEVIVITRGILSFPKSPEWDKVKLIQKSYQQNNPEWKKLLRDISADVTIDILGTDVPGTYETICSFCQHFIICGSVWMFGEPKIVPTPEQTQSPCIFPGYAKRYMEMLDIKRKALADGIKFTAIMPPNICGPGKIPLEGFGGRSLDVHLSHKRGEPVPLPENGQTLIGPCDAEDVARGFFLSAMNPEKAADEIFNVGSAYALTARQFVETYGKIYKVKIPIEWYSWKEYSERINPDVGGNYHFKAHMCPDITKISERLGYSPKYSPEESIERAVKWMRKEGML